MSEDVIMVTMEKENFGEKRKEGSFEQLRFTAESVASQEHPGENEDTYYADHESRSFGVFDGMGGHKGGAMASQIAKGYVESRLQELKKDSSFEEAALGVEEVLYGAHMEIRDKAEADSEKYGNMGTTVTIVKLWEGEGRRVAVIGNVGDSRAYRLRKEGELEPLTVDDGLARTEQGLDYALRLQSKFSNLTDLKELGEEEKRYWRYRNVLSQALGSDEMTPRIKIVDLEEGDRLILTTDGIHENLTDKEIAAHDTAKELVQAAKKRSEERSSLRAHPDDMTAVVIKV